MKQELEEEVLGDLDEQYRKALAKGVFRANVHYLYHVINYARPFAVRRIYWSSSGLKAYAFLILTIAKGSHPSPEKVGMTFPAVR